MKKLSVTFETVTPLFLGGAQPSTDSELRPPAFRGALRYWWRAAIGGVIGDQDLTQLSRLESLLFGTADEKIGASALVIRLRNSTVKKTRYSELVKGEKSKYHKWPGLDYLWFSVSKPEPSRMALEGKFGLDFQLRPGAKDVEQRLTEAYFSLWLWVNLGGLGSRARRAAGNLCITEFDGDFPLLQSLSLSTQANTPQELAEELKNGLNFCRSQLASFYPKGSVKNPSAFDLLHPSVCKIRVLEESYDEWQKALDQIGLIYQKFRQRRPPDYQNVKNALKLNRPLSMAVERAAFGLPIVFYFRSLNSDKWELKSDQYNRRASPLCFHVTRLANHRCAVVLIWFRSRFLPSNEKLKLVTKNSSLPAGDVPSDQLISEFLTQLNLIEVNYD